MKKTKLFMGLFVVFIFIFCLAPNAMSAKSDLEFITRSLKFSVEGFIDDDKTTFDTADFEDKSIKIEAKVKNKAFTDAEPVDVAFYVGKRRIGRVWLGILPARTTKTVSIHWIPGGPGEYTIKVVADYEGRVDEEDEMNNSIEKGIKITEGAAAFSLPRTIQTEAEVTPHPLPPPPEEGGDEE